MESNSVYNQDETEIDLMELLLAFWHRLWLICLAGLLGGTLAFLFSRYVLTPQYTSTAMLYVLSKETTLTSLADLQIGSQLTQDYQVLITSRPVLEDVIETLDLDITYKELRRKITIENPSSTRFLNVTVTDPDPRLAKQIVDEVAAVASDYIGDIMEMVPPKLIEDGEIPMEKSSPGNTRNAALGMLAGMVLVCGLITLEVIMNDTIRSEEDVTKYLNLTVLASVPERENEAAGDKKKRKKRITGPVLPKKAVKKKKKRQNVRKNERGEQGQADSESEQRDER